MIAISLQYRLWAVDFISARYNFYTYNLVQFQRHTALVYVKNIWLSLVIVNQSHPCITHYPHIIHTRNGCSQRWKGNISAIYHMLLPAQKRMHILWTRLRPGINSWCAVHPTKYAPGSSLVVLCPKGTRHNITRIQITRKVYTLCFIYCIYCLLMHH